VEKEDKMVEKEKGSHKPHTQRLLSISCTIKRTEGVWTKMYAKIILEETRMKYVAARG
jgi:hypothetical protein